MGCEFMLLGVVGGLLITATALVIQFFYDKTRKSEKDLKNELAFNR
ncbi:MAG: hypothetical protein ACE5SW_09820 [Nitrososphaeraceae archaeon]